MRWTFHAVLALSLAGACALFGTATLLLHDTLTRSALQIRTQSALSSQARQLSAQLEAGLLERQRDLAQLSLLMHLEQQPLDQRGFLNSLQVAFPGYAWIGVTDASGRVRAATGGLLEGQDVSTRPWFQQGRRGPWLGDVHEAKLLATLLPSAPDGPRRFVDVTVPLRDDRDRLIGVLGAHVDWSWVQSVRTDLLRTLDPAAAITVRLINAQGRVLIGPPETAGAMNTVQVTSGLSGAPQLGWKVQVSQPTTVAYADLTRFRQLTLTMHVVLTLLFATLGILLARWITQPIQALRLAAQQVQAGSSSVRLPPSSSFLLDEMRHLAAALQHLLSTVYDHEHELEVRIAQRTRELQDRTRESEALAALAGIAASDGDLADGVMQVAGILRTALAVPGVAVVSGRRPTYSCVIMAPDRAGWPSPPVTWQVESDVRLPGWPVTVMSVPLHSGVGTAYLVLPAAQYNPRLVRAAQQAVQVRAERSEAVARLRDAAQRDALTGLGNRRALDEALSQLGQNPATLLLMDLDGLKRLNDAHGHDVGDALLQQFAASLSRTLPEAGHYRLGGDEFAVLTRDVSRSGDLMQAVRRAVIETRQLGFDMDASVGRADYPTDGLSGAALLRAADQRMYAMKRERSRSPLVP